jgi:hypothetical protein
VSDREIRRLERSLARNRDPETALALYVARRRMGDERAGARWYEWLTEDPDEFIRDPYSMVFLVDDVLYCDECGVTAAHAFDPIELPAWGEYYDLYDEAYTWGFEVVEEELTANYADHFYTILSENELEVDKDNLLRCRSCETLLKLDTHPIGWKEALTDEIL